MNITGHIPAALVAGPTRGQHAEDVRRQEFYHDNQTPAANSMTPTAFAAVRDDHRWALLGRRSDSDNWELPGGRVELGKSAATAAEREVARGRRSPWAAAAADACG